MILYRHVGVHVVNKVRIGRTVLACPCRSLGNVVSCEQSILRSALVINRVKPDNIPQEPVELQVSRQIPGGLEEWMENVVHEVSEGVNETA